MQPQIGSAFSLQTVKGRKDVALEDGLPVVDQPVLQGFQPHPHQPSAVDIYRTLHDRRVVPQRVHEGRLVLRVCEREVRCHEPITVFPFSILLFELKLQKIRLRF
jgi:hypothetical protein